jgi:endonuclease/exonuclease/phosphatase family metal-dependent hydrolase
MQVVRIVGCMLSVLLFLAGIRLSATEAPASQAAAKPFTSPQAATAGQPLRIVTFNAEILAAPRTSASKLSRYRFDSARQAHLERVAAIIETLHPDILNLLEVTSVEAVDMLIEILHEKGLTDYRGYHVESKDAFTGLDVALITRFTPDTIEGAPIRLIFSSADDPTWRSKFTFVDKEGATQVHETSLMRNAVYYITVGNHKLGFLGLHLKSNPEDAYSNGRRTGEAAVARLAIRQEIVARGYKPIVLGDLNDYDADVPDRDETRNPATNVLQQLKDYDDGRMGPELMNVAAKIARQSDRYTSLWDRNENGAEDAGDVMTMIDHILVHHSLWPHVTRVHISHINGLETSDHYPIVVDLVLPE